MSASGVVVLNNSRVSGNVAGVSGSGGGMLLTERAQVIYVYIYTHIYVNSKPQTLDPHPQTLHPTPYT